MKQQKYNKPYIWWDPKKFPMNGYGLYSNSERKTNSYIFMHGMSLPYDSGNPNLSATLQSPEDYDLIFTYRYPELKLRTYDCLPNTGQAPLVNKKVLDLLRVCCPNDIQAFPVVIKNEKKKIPNFENKDYYLINVTSLVEAINFQDSIVTYFSSGRVDDIKKLVMKSDCMESHHLARNKDYTPQILISPELVSLFKKEKITGVRFITDEEAYSYIPPEELLWSYYQENPETAKRFFIGKLSNNQSFAELKESIRRAPKEALLYIGPMIKLLVEMTLSRSSLHQKECEELLELIVEILS